MIKPNATINLSETTQYQVFIRDVGATNTTSIVEEIKKKTKQDGRQRRRKKKKKRPLECKLKKLNKLKKKPKDLD